MGAISYTLCAMDAINLLISRTRRGRGTLHSWAWLDQSDLAGPGPVSAAGPELELRRLNPVAPSLRLQRKHKKEKKKKKNSRKFAVSAAVT